MPKPLPENPEPPQTYNTDGHQTPTVSLYELSREERIKENLQRMQKLGIVDLSHKLKSLTPRKRTPRGTTLSDSPRPTGPVRRSSRLQNVTPVSYSEVVLSKKDMSLEDEDVKLREGSKPEVYTEEHEKQLGNTERSWTFFVDGYGEDGKRIYDPVKGKTCHQCRQKTLGHRTHCSKCNMVQGQFCGDCLYMRYGEHVLEAIENPNWICPVCRGICNCSLCRQAKGWCPTGALYKKISNLGYKSVAHYLIQTRSSQTNLEKDHDTNNQLSAKRSISFSDLKALSKESLKVNENQLGTSKPQSDDRKNDDLNIEKENKIQGNPNPASNQQTSTKRMLPFLDTEVETVNADCNEVDSKVQNHCGFLKIQLEDNTDDGFKGEEERKSHYTDKEHNGTNNITLASTPKPKKKRAAIEPSPDSIASRLRQRRRKGNDCDVTESTMVNEKSSDVKCAVSNVWSDKESEKEKEMQITEDKHGGPELKSEPAVAIEPSPDSIASRLRQRRRKGNDRDVTESTVVKEKSLDVKCAVSNVWSDKESEKEKEMQITEDKHGGLELKSEPAVADEPNREYHRKTKAEA